MNVGAWGRDCLNLYISPFAIITSLLHSRAAVSVFLTGVTVYSLNKPGEQQRAPQLRTKPINKR